MANNTVLNPGALGDTIATEEISGVKHELVKIEFGVDGVATKVSASNPLPTTDSAAEVSLASIDLKLTNPLPVSGTVSTGGLTDTQLRASAVPVSAAALPLPSGAATSALQTQPGVDIGDVTINNASGASAVNIQDGGNSITVDGTVALGAGSQVIGHVIADTGSTTAVTGNVTVIQGTASNLKTAATLDAETTKVIGTINVAASQTIAATQATAANLNMTEASAASILTKLTAGATTMVKLEDVASADADAGVPVLAVRKATPANTSGSDGDYEFLQMSAGKLWVQAGATQKPSIGATTVMTVTNLQSLASSATAGWQSAKVSNLATLANDYEIFVKLTTANTAPANDKAMYVFICPFYTTDAGTTWFASSQGTTTLPTGTEGTTTIASPHNLRLLGVLNYTTAQMVVQDTFMLSNCFGNRLPDGFSIVIINFSGAALSTGCVVDYSPINDILV